MLRLVSKEKMGGLLPLNQQPPSTPPGDLHAPPPPRAQEPHNKALAYLQPDLTEVDTLPQPWSPLGRGEGGKDRNPEVAGRSEHPSVRLEGLSLGGNCGPAL